MAIIYKDFASGLADLDKTIIHDDMVAVRGVEALPDGVRAYLHGGKAYVGAIHFQPIGEDYDTHLGNAKKLELDPKFHGRVYIGAAGIVNLEYLSASRAAAGILIDINPLQTQFNRLMISKLAEYSNPDDFCDFLRTYSKTHLSEYKMSFCTYDLSCRSDLRNAFEKESVFRASDVGSLLDKWALWPETNWLNDEGRLRYRHLHDMARHEALGALTIDVCDRAACMQLREYMDTQPFHALDVSRGHDGAEIMNADHGMCSGADAGIMYRSNILTWLDFTGRRPNATPKEARMNMDLWFAPGVWVVDIDSIGMNRAYEAKLAGSVPPPPKALVAE